MKPNLKILANASHDGAAYWFLGGLTVVKINAAQSGGALSVILDHLPPGRSTPYHVHRNDDETFYMLEGEATFMSGSQKMRCAAGSTIFLPRDIPHGFRAETAAKILIVTTPGGFDQFVAEAGEPAKSMTLPPPREPDFQALATIAARFGIEILGPLPA